MSELLLETPVVFLIFNRPQTTQRVFERIRQAKPTRLLVIADGARQDRPEEAEKCAATQAIIEQVDWNCQVLKNYSDVNLGCKQRVASGLDWAFSQVEEAIILEDDCVPDPSFFPFCQELLIRYREDERIMAIAGNNFQQAQPRTPYSYYFSRYNHIWGWASWRRAWQHYDVTMKQWANIREGNWLQDILQEPQTVKYWTKIFQTVYEGKIDTWDYAWTFACWLQSGLTILPQSNLVSNIGFHSEATHTKDRHSRLANLPVTAIKFPLHHPPFMIRDIQADQRTDHFLFKASFTEKLKGKINQLF